MSGDLEMSSSTVVILSACRTPIGKFCGALQKNPAHELGALVIQESIKRANVATSDIDEIIMGQSLTAGQGQNPARQAALLAGVPVTIPAYGINMLCGSGLKAVFSGWQSISTGQSKLVVVGGQESMSLATHSTYIRMGVRYNSAIMDDTVLVDGLTDPILKMHMGQTAESLADKFKVSREEQDAFAYRSQNLCSQAIASGYFKDEIVGVPVPFVLPVTNDMTLIETDEFPRSDTTLEKLAKLKPAFIKTGTVTPGNASGINDGAAAVVLCDQHYATTNKLQPLAKIIGFAQAGIEPIDMGLGPVNAIEKLLCNIGWTIDEVDLYEINEAFAVQAILCARLLKINSEKLNISGGAIALGHPIGASGARVLVTLLHNMHRLNKKKGVAALCIGGGMGIAIAIESEGIK